MSCFATWTKNQQRTAATITSAIEQRAIMLVLICRACCAARIAVTGPCVAVNDPKLLWKKNRATTLIIAITTAVLIILRLITVALPSTRTHNNVTKV
jgi:hypothetical protein